ncbi:MAG: hypothetical protein EA408_03900 [Marinilabiliales bacterium]|nr:MAG: hypothetical protein EA408_03900 [Marinilabiliales bacterium]
MFLTLLFLHASLSCSRPEPVPVGRAGKDAGQWYDDKFSMFIHWGIYSVPGGVWDGEPVSRGYSEQIQAHAGIYSDVYAALAERFDPQRWDPDSIVLLAKAAGMRSVVITSKHHDGFCMFRSDHTGYNVAEATPYGRDVIKELAEACERHGLRFGLYFSLIDWHYPPAYPISSHNADPIPDEHHRYNMNQVRELLTRYGPISELWFDMGSLGPGQSRELRDLVHELQPETMVSGRLGNDMGDFTVLGDNEVPDYTLDTPWQTPASMFHETWSYRSWQERGDPAVKIREKLEDLITVVSRGGNYLLNIGPRGDGSVVEFEREVLLGIGRWLEVNGEAIYGTRPAGIYGSPPWGEITSACNRLYLHIFDPPANGMISLQGIQGRVTGAYMLDNPATGIGNSNAGNRNSNISIGNSDPGSTITISLPAGGDFSDIRVAVLEFEDGFTAVPENTVGLYPFGETQVLDRRNSHQHFSFSGVDYYSSFRSIVRESWTFDGEAAGTWKPYLWYSSAEKGRKLEIVTPEGIRLVELSGGEEVWLDRDSPQQRSSNTNAGFTAIERGNATGGGPDGDHPAGIPSGISFGEQHVNGPHSMRIDRITGMEGNVDTGRPWPGPGGREWEALVTGEDGLTRKPAGRNHCWYLWQEIRSEAEQDLLVRLRRTDGVQVFLNGSEIYLHNNPGKDELVEDIVLLPLIAGPNELLVKFYNRFGRTTAFAAGYDTPQLLYRKTLDGFSLSGQAGQQVSWHLHDPVSLHSNMAMPNLRLELEYIGR